MLQGNTILLGELFGLVAEGFGQARSMGGEVGIPNLVLIEIAVDAAFVVEPSLLATKAQTIETGQNEADQPAKT